MRDGAGLDGDRTSGLNVDQKQFNLRKFSREAHLPAFTRQAVIHPVMSFKGNVLKKSRGQEDRSTGLFY